MLVAFVLVPIIEIWSIIQVGQAIGAWWTIGLLLASGLLGSWLVRREGARAWRAFQTAVANGAMPAREIADGALILIGGTLMLTPGFVTDAVALVLILPMSRSAAVTLLARVLERRWEVSVTQHRPGSPGAGPVIRGDVVD